jgi:hypothetical protein
MFIHISGGSWGKHGVRAFSGKASFDGILGPRDTELDASGSGGNL